MTLILRKISYKNNKATTLSAAKFISHEPFCLNNIDQLEVVKLHRKVTKIISNISVPLAIRTIILV